jgi:hypothetical protein
MKAVVYHADGPIAKNFPKDTYKTLFKILKENLKTFDIPLIHITLHGHEGWGDENYFYDRDPANIIYNREELFIEFLKNAEDNVYWFAEPDHRLNNIFPPLATDLALLFRKDSTPITPSWRLAKKSAIPFFEEVFSYYDTTNKSWNSDSGAYNKMWEIIGSPTETGVIHYNNMSIDLRPYKQYSMRKSGYSQQFKGLHKFEIIKDNK